MRKTGTICGTIIAAFAILSANCTAAAAQFERPTGELQEKAQALADLAVKEGMQGALQFCGFDGKPPLVKKATLDEALKPCRHESDPVPDAEGLKKWHMIFGMGYGLWGESDDISRVFGHGGVGGSEGLCDRSQRLVIGYTCNFDNAPPKLREAFYSLVGMRWRHWKDDVNIQDLQMATAEKGNVASGGSGKSPRGSDLALADAETVEVADAVQDVRAVSRQGAATLFVNGVRFATAEPDADGNITFRSVPFVRGVTQLQLEAGGRAVKVSKRRGRPEGAPKGVEVKKREDPRTAWFEDARFGLFIHWGIYSIPGRGEWTYATDDWKPGEYESLAGQFNPTNYNPRKWARLAKAAGMKYVVFTTRHHDGFCMFDSHFSDYKITKTPYGKDTLRMLVDAFRAEGLRIGFYHSLPDWTHPGYADLETPIGIKTGKVAPYDAAKHEKFKRLVYNHVNQLTTENGKIDLMFFDFTSKFKDGVDYFDRDALIALCRRNQPDMLINDRLAYFKDRAPDFDYYTPEVAVPSAAPIVRGTERPWETCATMNDHWGYARDDHNFKSVETLVAGLVGCVSRNGNLLLNVGPTELGEFPPESVACLEGLADWYASNGESITGCGKSDLTPPFGCAYTQKGSSLYCHVLVPPMGDLILPGLDGRTARLTMLRTGEPVETIDFWGFETLRLGDLRIRAKGLRVGDVVKIELNQ